MHSKSTLSGSIEPGPERVDDKWTGMCYLHVLYVSLSSRPPFLLAPSNDVLLWLGLLINPLINREIWVVGSCCRVMYGCPIDPLTELDICLVVMISTSYPSIMLIDSWM